MTPCRVVAALLTLLPLGCSPLVSPDIHQSTRVTSVQSDAIDEEAYWTEVRDYTYAYVDADGEAPDFAGGLVTIAARHGVANWDTADGTWIAIGAGLARAQVSSATLADFKRTVGHADPLRMADIQRGFDAGR